MTSARDQIIRILQSLTDISAAELGRRVGVSRERVRQILKDLGYPTARGKGRPFGTGPLHDGDGPMRARLTRSDALKVVAEDLLRRKLAIFAPLRTAQACDLIAVDTAGAVRAITICIEGPRGRQASRLRLTGSLARLVRHCAWVTPGAPVRYDPPLEAASRKRARRR